MEHSKCYYISKLEMQSDLFNNKFVAYTSSFNPLRLLSLLVTQSCLTLCNPMDCSPPGSSVHGILQEGILEWVATPFCRGSSWPRDRTWVSCVAGGFFTGIRWKVCCTQYVSKFGKLISGHRTGKCQFSFQCQRRAKPKNVQKWKWSCLVVSNSLRPHGL